MAESILITASVVTATATNSTEYWPLATTNLRRSATEAQAQIPYHTPGTIAKLYVRISANTVNGTSSLKVRKNGADTGLTISIANNATGVMENTSNSVVIADGDRLCYQTIPGAATGAISFSVVSVVFTPTDTTITESRLAATFADVTYTTASTSRYNTPGGDQSSGVGVESSTQAVVNKAGKVKFLAIYVSANARINDTTVRIRKNAANTTLVLSVGAGVTGWIEDVVHEDTVAAGDKLNYAIVTGTGTENLVVQTLVMSYISTTNHGWLVCGRAGGIVVTSSTTNYFPIGGRLVLGTNENNTKSKAMSEFNFSDLSISVTSNTISGASIFRLKKNGSNANSSISIPSNTAAFLSDSTNEDQLIGSDEIGTEIISGATGTSMTIRNYTIMTYSEIVEPEPPAAAGAIGSRQGRSPIYRTVKPKAVAVVIRLKVQLEYVVTKLTIKVGVVYQNERPKPLIKYASAIIGLHQKILPLRIRPTPKPVIRTITTQVSYEVQSIQLKSACAYEVDKLITRQHQTKLRTIATNFLLSDV